MTKKLISVVIPMYFEEAVAEECYQRLTKVMVELERDYQYELVFVNDGSTDRTLEILTKIAAKDQHVRVLSFSRNFGHQIAVTAGVDRARGAAVVIIDADLQDPPELILEMIKLWQQGYEVVYAKRKKREGETWFKLITAKYFYRILAKLTEVNIPTDTGDFRLLDRKVVEVLKQMPERNRFLRGMVSWVGFKQIPLEYERKERFAGETKYPLKKMLKFAFDGIYSFSTKPVKYFQTLGVFLVLVAVVDFLGMLLGQLVAGNAFNGWSVVILLLIFFSGVQLIALGVMGEYLTRIYEESKDRPLYIIDIELEHGKVVETKE